MRSISATNRYDPNLKRLLYIRYADDFVILMRGSLEEANRMKRHVKDFLMKQTGLELNDEKTLVTSTRKPFNFLGATCKRVINMGKMTTLRGSIMKGPISKRTTPRMRIDTCASSPSSCRREQFRNVDTLPPLEPPARLVPRHRM